VFLVELAMAMLPKEILSEEREKILQFFLDTQD
jgi:hypothetical protein